MSRFFVSPEQITGERIHITGPDVRHITRVLRMAAGDELTISDGRGHEYRAGIVEANEREVICQIQAVTGVNREAPVRVNLVQGLPKGDKMELIIQKCTELGVAEFIPVITQRTVVRLEEDKARQRRERWQRVAGEAAKQAGRTIVPTVGPVVSLQEALDRIPEGALALMPWEEERTAGIKQQLHGYNGLKEIYIIIGPEGGLTPEEARMAEQAGVVTVSMGPRIMRTETAGLAAVTMVLYELGDLGG